HFYDCGGLHYYDGIERLVAAR
ncbi:MAG: hypothetical protein CFH35_00096, partial [Alphaproteobacteria bacterium MarineAlpha9_Bin5]